MDMITEHTAARTVGVGGAARGAPRRPAAPGEASKKGLTSTQLQLLLEAAERKDAAIVFPNRYRGRIVRQIAESLLNRGFAREMPAKPGSNPWRRDDAGSFLLVLTPLGRKAVREFNKTQPFALAICPAPGVAAQREAVQESVLTARGAAPAPEASASGKVIGKSSLRTGSKIGRVVALLQRPEGASMEELSRETGWLVHTTRAALTGLRKRGHVIERCKVNDASGWRIASREPGV